MLEKAIEIIRTLQQHGNHALLVGGCVRDQLLGRDPKDFDIVTSSTPEEVQMIFKDTIPVGEQFGVVVVNKDFEVATFRMDDYNSNSFNVELLNARKHSLEEMIEKDSSRRDLTLNSSYYDPIEDKYYDPQNGIKDLEEGIIRFVGDVRDRIKEDPIRILRFFRFVARYPHMDAYWGDFDIIEHGGHFLKDVSVERIFQELTKILLEFPKVALTDFQVLLWCLKDIIPELYAMMSTHQNRQWHPESDVGTHTYQTLKSLRIVNEVTVWASLLHDVGKVRTTRIDENGKITSHCHEHVGAEMAEEILRRLHCSNKFIKDVCFIVKQHMRIKGVARMRSGKVHQLMMEENYDLLKEVSCADSMGAIGALEWFHWLNDFEKKSHHKKGVKLKKLIQGVDLIDKGLQPGPHFKDLLQEAYNLQLENPEYSKEDIMEKLDLSRNPLDK